jgi:flagellar hook protein FlgE
MSQGLFTSASGIRVNQTSLDVISNNLANVNTIAFKGSKANFATTFFKTIYGGQAPNGSQGGSNPIQVGSGAQLSDIALNQNQGGTQFTGRSTDLAISGGGYFLAERADITTGATTTYLTRAGNFSLDANSNLVTADGGRIRGTSSTSGTAAATEYHINVPQTLKIAKFLDATDTELGSSLGSLAAVVGDFTAVAGATQTRLDTVTLKSFTIGNNGAIEAHYSNGDKIGVRVNPDTSTGRTELVHTTSAGNVFAGVNTTIVPKATSTTPQNNGPVNQLAGALAVFGSNTGGNPLEGMQLQIQTVIPANPNGLLSDGKNGYVSSANSGAFTYGTPGNGSNGKLEVGSLETSNVDLSLEFTNLVVAQRGLEANSRMMRAQSEVLQNIIQAV